MPSAYSKLFNAPGNVPISVAWEDMGYTDGVRLVSEDGVFRGLGTAFADVVHKDMDFDTAKALTAAELMDHDDLIEHSLQSESQYNGRGR